MQRPELQRILKEKVLNILSKGKLATYYILYNMKVCDLGSDHFEGGWRGMLARMDREPFFFMVIGHISIFLICWRSGSFGAHV